MAVLYITEYVDIDGTRQVPTEPPLAQQTLVVGAAVSSNPFNAKTTVVRLHTDAICSYLFGTEGLTVTATTSSARMAANQTEYHGVAPRQTVSVIANT